MSTDSRPPKRPASRSSQSPPSKGPSQDLLKAGTAAMSRRCAVSRRASLRVCELAQAQGTRRVLRGGRPASSRRSTPTTSSASRTMMTRNPATESARSATARMGRSRGLPNARVPWEPPGPVRTGAWTEWMITHGSDVHKGATGPHASGAQRLSHPDDGTARAHGADVNALWHGHFPIIFASCESRTGCSQMAISITAQIRTAVTMGTSLAAIHIRARLSTTSSRYGVP